MFSVLKTEENKRPTDQITILLYITINAADSAQSRVGSVRETIEGMATTKKYTYCK
jgi:hypothetical protein